MTTRRIALNQFGTAEPIYANAPVWVWGVDLTTKTRTTELITLYEGPTGTGVLANPQTLDSDGKWAVVPYVDRAFQIVVRSLPFGEHALGIVYLPGMNRGDWMPGVEYARGDVIRDTQAGNNTLSIYSAGEDHLSSASFATDLAAGKWMIYIDVDVLNDTVDEVEALVTIVEGYKNAAAASASDAADSATLAAAEADTATMAAATATVAAATATTQAGIATTQAGLAATAKTAAEAAQTAAEAAQTAAELAETNALASETAAGASETAAAASASTATTQAGIATGAASDALDSETAAGASAIAAAASAVSAAASFDSFDDRYLGPKAADPTLDNDGNALIAGAIYFNTSSNIMKVWNGATWDVTLALASPLGVAAGGTGGTDAATARHNLGLDSVVALSGTSSSPMLQLTQLGSGPVLLAEDTTSPDATPFVVLGDGRVVIGDTAVRSFYGHTALTPQQVYLASDDTANGGGVFALNYDASTAAPAIILAKSRGDAINTRGIVGSTDPLGYLYFMADDGAGAVLVRAAYVAAVVDGTPGTNDMPTRIVIATTPDGQATPTEKFRADNGGRMVGGGTSFKTFASSIVPMYQAIGADAGAAGYGAAAYVASAVGASFNFAKSRHATFGSHTIVQSGDTIGSINWGGSNGTTFDPAVQIVGEVGGTPGASADMPGRLRIKVSPDGSATPADALVINPDKTLQLPGYGAGVMSTDASGNISVAAAGGQTLRSVSSNDTLGSADAKNIVRCTADLTLAITAAATLGAGWWTEVIIDGDYNDFRVVTIDPNSTEEIDEQTTARAYVGERFIVYCDGSKFRTTRQSGLVFVGTLVTTSGTAADVSAAGAFLDDVEAAAMEFSIQGYSYNSGSTLSVRLFDSGGTIDSNNTYYANYMTAWGTPAGTETATATEWGILSGGNNSSVAAGLVRITKGGTTQSIFSAAAIGAVQGRTLVGSKAITNPRGVRFVSGGFDAGTIECFILRKRAA